MKNSSTGEVLHVGGILQTISEDATMLEVIALVKAIYLNEYNPLADKYIV